MSKTETEWNQWVICEPEIVPEDITPTVKLDAIGKLIFILAGFGITSLGFGVFLVVTHLIT